MGDLKNEIKTLENVSRELFLEVHEMKTLKVSRVKLSIPEFDDLNCPLFSKIRSEKSETLEGRFFNLFGYIFILVCIYKMAMVE